MLSGQCPHSDPGFGELCRHVGASIGQRHVKDSSERLPREAVMETSGAKKGKVASNKQSTAIGTVNLNAGRQQYLVSTTTSAHVAYLCMEIQRIADWGLPDYLAPPYPSLARHATPHCLPTNFLPHEPKPTHNLQNGYPCTIQDFAKSCDDMLTHEIAYSLPAS